MSDLLTVVECAERLRVSRTCVYQQIIRPRAVPIVKIGSRTLIAAADLDRWIESQRKNQAA